SPARLEEARAKFEAALNSVVGSAAKLSAHPLAAMLSNVGEPFLVQEIAKDLYKTEVVRLSKELTTPMADALFRHPGAMGEALVRVEAAAGHPVFNQSSLLPQIRKPTY